MAFQLVNVSRARGLLGAGLLLAAMGCGAKSPVVSGKVTLDGEPLPQATVIFMPNDETRSPAQGTTDALGQYTLEQESGTAGVQAGAYSVRITTYQPGSQDVDQPTPVVKERVPMRYNLNTELTVVVESEQSTESPFDFPLESGGPVFQPAPDAF